MRAHVVVLRFKTVATSPPRLSPTVWTDAKAIISPIEPRLRRKTAKNTVLNSYWSSYRSINLHWTIQPRQHLSLVVLRKVVYTSTGL